MGFGIVVDGKAGMLEKLFGINIGAFDCVKYTELRVSNYSLGLLDAIKLTGETLEVALASREGFNAPHATLEDLKQICAEIRKTRRSDIPQFLFVSDRCVPRRFIVGGTILVYEDQKYVLALHFIGDDMFVKPVALSVKNLPCYYFLVGKKERSA